VASAGVASGAVAFVGTVEQRESAQFRGRKAQLPRKKQVVLRVERAKVGIEPLVLIECEGHRQYGRLFIVENIAAKHLLKLSGVRRGGKARHEVRGRRIRHLMRRK